MTSVPYPTFTDISIVKQYATLSCVGRCRIQLASSSSENYVAIRAKCVEQAHALDGSDDASLDVQQAAKKSQKKYMKQSVALASDFLRVSLGLDVSVVDVEVHLLNIQDVLDTDGCIASCFLDAGCSRIVLSTGPLLRDAIQAARVPRDRLAVHIEIDATTEATSALARYQEAAQQVQADCDTMSIFLDIKSECNSNSNTDITPLLELLTLDTTTLDMGVVVQIPAPSDSDKNGEEDMGSALSNLVGSALKSTGSHSARSTITLLNPTVTQLGRCYAASLRTDRTDGLFTTVVCTRTGEALGLVYSSVESIVAALECGRGVYYSRSRQSLWRKGDTSGHYQTLHRLDVDCDSDALRFTVTQRNTETSPGAFCHLETLTCWGEPRGLRHLEQTLRNRLHAAPEGSYTKRLFDDDNLLREKLVEEAQELAEADTAAHVAEELADVLYFAMVRAAKFGVSLDDAAAELDRRTRKVTRRAGDSKSFRTEAARAILEKAKESES